MKFLLLWLLVLSPIFAKNYALVIGLNHGALQGALNDASAMATLLKSYGIKNIEYLPNEKATRSNILMHLNATAKALNRDDRFYLFFSGHGTSLLDPNFKTLIEKDAALASLLENSGALIPWDFDPHNARESIISAKRDLAPVFQKIDKKGGFAMVMIDACFSGMGYKEFNPDTYNIPIPITPHFDNEKYPYERIVYIASTSMSDLAAEDMNEKPYRGYFSKVLERCLYANDHLSSLKDCISVSSVPQAPVIYPEKKDLTLFLHPKPYKKDIDTIRKSDHFARQLFSLADGAGEVEIFATQKNGIHSDTYNASTPLNLKIHSTKEGYLVFITLGASGKLKLHYPKHKLKKIRRNTTEELMQLRADEPFGEEHLGAFLVDLETANIFREIYLDTMGNIEHVISIKNIIELLRRHSIGGVGLRLTSKKE